MKTLITAIVLFASLTAATAGTSTTPCCAPPALSVEEAALADLLAPRARLDYRLHQNPTRTNHFTLALQSINAEAATVEILNQLGQPVYSTQTIATHLYKTFDLNPLTPGRYLLRIKAGGQTVEEPLHVL